MSTRQSQSRQSYGGQLYVVDNDARLAAIPTGGTTNQVLAKTSNSNYATQWVTPASGGGGGGLTPTTSKTSAYTAAAGELVRANANGGGFTVTLPSTTTAGTSVGVKKTDTSAFAVTVQGSGGTTIDGDATCTLNTTGASGTFVFDGTNWQIQSTAVVNTGTDSLQSLLVPTYQAGYWYDRRATGNLNGALNSITVGTAGTSSFANSTISYIPCFVHRSLVIDTLGIITGSSVPTAGATVRLGLYTNTSSNQPGTRLYDWGTISPTQAATNYTLAAAGTIPKGWSWWALSLNATSVGSLYSLNASYDQLVMAGLTAFTNASIYRFGIEGYYESATTLSATATPTAINPVAAYSMPNIWFKVAS